MSSLAFPDQSHINRIRDALWRQPDGQASIMIGAGFSRNAQKIGPGIDGFPLWHDVAKLLCGRLYPETDGQRLQKALNEASGTSGFLRLAQEYEAAFGRGALNKLIKEVVPDESYVPGNMHARLLRLPWKDVFTTNWDTLLERAQYSVADRAYSVIRTPEEIASAAKPRIVKLHGSLPENLPLVFTEEDYRKYPRQFSPFVNTVQQAMMETVFCLIGFSGDDPNFLHWSGWVRDNLGDAAPKIYLAGWLDLSPHRRRMLEDRNVVPIDLARHPNALKWPEHLRHSYATDWLLHTFEHGRPYDVTHWPSPGCSKAALVPEHLQPVETASIFAPIDEQLKHEENEEGKNHLESVRSVVRIWANNRKLYPGWLFLHPSKHFHMERNTDNWEPIIIGVLTDTPPVEKIFLLRELAWRRQIQLDTISSVLESAISDALQELDCQTESPPVF